MPNARRLRRAFASALRPARVPSTLHPRIWTVAALGAFVWTACATGGDDTDGEGDDSGVVVMQSDAASDAPGDDDASYGGYDSSTDDAGSQADSASGVDAFPPPGDASASSDSATSPDASSPDTGSTGGCSFTGALATFALTGQTGDEASVAATSSAPGVTVGALSRSTGLTAASGSGSINSSGWPTTASASATHYYTFSVTPPTGCALSLSTLALDVKASATGPETGDVATSADAFATHSASFAGTSSTNVTLSATGTSAIEVRVYGYAATGSGGTFRIQDTLTLSGSIE